MFYWSFSNNFEGSWLCKNKFWKFELWRSVLKLFEFFCCFIMILILLNLWYLMFYWSFSNNFEGSWLCKNYFSNLSFALVYWRFLCWLKLFWMILNLLNLWFFQFYWSFFGNFEGLIFCKNKFWKFELKMSSLKLFEFFYVIFNNFEFVEFVIFTILFKLF